MQKNHGLPALAGIDIAAKDIRRDLSLPAMASENFARIQQRVIRPKSLSGCNMAMAEVELAFSKACRTAG